MFEKEAEEYVRKIRRDVINWCGTEPEERFYNEIKFKQAYLAGAEFGYSKSNEQIIKAKEDYKTAYIKGMRHLANALKDYDRTEGAWTDYFEHTVDKVLKRELN